MFSSTLRGMIKAPPGRMLFCADYAAIEARVLFWVAEHDKGTKAFETGADLYLDMASVIFNVDRKKLQRDYDDKKSPNHARAKEMREIGKRTILGSGYGMGFKKFHQTCADYGQEIGLDLAEKAINAYRSLHSPVPMLWRNLERAAIKAVAEKKAVSINKVTFYVKNNFLYCRLPSGRKLAYYKPSVTTKTMKWGAVPELRFWSVNSTTKQWEESVNWGGVLTENIVQAIARDLMADAMLRLDRKGYKVILSVHDELLSEAPKGFGSSEEFSKIMSLTPEWASGLPVNVEGWSRERYGK